MLDVRDVCVRFGERTVLDRVSLTVGDAEVVALQGPSGSGKSTLLRVIAGLLAPDSGTIVSNGGDITTLAAHRRGIGLVFQDDQLFPHFDVAGNVEFGLRMHGMARAQRQARVAEVLSLVGLPDTHGRSVNSLSGGEAKRVALARSLAPEPPVLLLDEPLTGLDRELHDRLTDDLARLLRATRTSVLMVTHDADEAARIADRIISWAI
ncbi:MAG: ABC transporter ATP-binding protein [Ilumatobacteraceae bacterium]|jgi:thiamine transport system ATP-binding protein